LDPRENNTHLGKLCVCAVVRVRVRVRWIITCGSTRCRP
jgi:hypothetical protein